MAKNKKNKPVAQYRNGNLKSCIWQDEIEKDGQTESRNTISVQKGYKDAKSGEWVNFELRLFPAEAERLISVLQAAYDDCAIQRTA